MTKAYLAGFIAGTMGKTWEECPFKDGIASVLPNGALVRWMAMGFLLVILA